MVDKAGNVKSKILENIKSLGVAIGLALVLITFVIQAFKIPSGSMENTLLIGDHLFVTKFIYNIGVEVPPSPIPMILSKFKIDVTPRRFHLFNVSKPKHGDIVIFVFPNDPKKDFIKRCIGVPDDKIEIKNKIVYVNDEPLEEKYVIHKDSFIIPKEFQPRDNFGPITVPAGKYFMLGDNRDTSYDSRFWGFLDEKLIKGKALIKYWPITRIGLIK